MRYEISWKNVGSKIPILINNGTITRLFLTKREKLIDLILKDRYRNFK